MGKSNCLKRITECTDWPRCASKGKGDGGNPEKVQRVDKRRDTRQAFVSQDKGSRAAAMHASKPAEKLGEELALTNVNPAPVSGNLPVFNLLRFVLLFMLPYPLPHANMQCMHIPTNPAPWHCTRCSEAVALQHMAQRKSKG